MYLECRLCKLLFENDSSLSQHMIIDHGEETTAVSEINLSTMATIDIEATCSGETTKDDDHPCLECGKVYKSKMSMRRHVRIQHSFGTGFSCKICPETFARNALLTQHLKESHSDDPTLIRCNVCDKIFANKGSQSQHMKTHRNERPFQCSICTNSYKTSRDLAHHEQSHSTVREYGCEQCGKLFIRARDLKHHIRTHSQVKPFTCDVCSKSFRSKGILNQHSKLHTNPNDFACFICEKTLATKHGLKRHLVTHKQKKQFQCTQCEKAYHFSFKLVDHVRREHNKERNFECNVCKKRFGSRDTLRIHCRIHTGESPFKCKYCDRSFKQVSNKARHERTHNESKPFKCKSCSKAFHNQEDFVQHESIHNYPNDKPFECRNCDKRFLSSHGLDYHAKRDHMIPSVKSRHVCVTCDKSFQTAAQLNEHVKRHIGNGSQGDDGDVARQQLISDVEKNGENIGSRKWQISFFCEECGQGFYLEQSKNNHVTKVHRHFKCELCKLVFKTEPELDDHIPDCSGFPPTTFLCTTCDSVFTCRSNLKRHMEVHLESEPVQCDQCDKIFRNEKLVKRHLIVHSHDRPFKCDNCDKAFRRSNDLLKHKRIHTGEKPFQCRYCERTFRQSNNRDRHEKTHGKTTNIVGHQGGTHFTTKSDFQRHAQIHEGARGEHEDRNEEMVGGVVTRKGRIENDLDIEEGREAFDKEQDCSNMEESLDSEGGERISEDSGNFNAERMNVDEGVSMRDENNDEVVVDISNNITSVVSTNDDMDDGYGVVLMVRNDVTDAQVRVENGNEEQETTCDVINRNNVTTVCNDENASARKRDEDIEIRKILESKPFVCPSCERGYSTKHGLKYHFDKAHRKIYNCRYCKTSFNTEKKLWSHNVKVHNTIESSSEDSDLEVDEGQQSITGNNEGSCVLAQRRPSGSECTRDDSTVIEECKGIDMKDDDVGYVNGKRVIQSRITNWFQK